MAEKDSWQRLTTALDSGNMDAIRAAVANLDPRGEELLAEHIGGDHVERGRRAVRRSRDTRRAVGGRVIVIHGIMGAQLDVVRSGDIDRVWVNYLRLAKGRIGDLELVHGTRPKDSGVTVQVAGIFPEYLPLLLELDQIWKVTPFAYDWRLDIDDAAAKLAELVKTWAAGEPCHIVAHSMGGLVARRMMQLFPAVWTSMVDPQDRKRGGRLIQLGTPNRGSFAIPLMLTGGEPLVRKLAFFDHKHKLDKLLPILASFPGPYQMLPAPGSAASSDDRDKLYTLGAWGSKRPVEDFLALGRRFHKALETVVSPEAIVYVAGYDQDTPYRIQVTNPGEFAYQITGNGDGRVPHDLGLLDGARTLWVNEQHGDLAGNANVLAGIHGLLSNGNTLELEQTLPGSRRRAASDWIKTLPPDASEHEAKAMTVAAVPARGIPRPARDTERAEALLVRGFVGSPADGKRGADRRPKRAGGKKPKPKPADITIEIVCGDLTKVAGDVYAVGHYVGVLPQAAERALDGVLSTPGSPEESRVLVANTRLGLLRGDLGDVRLFPWADGSGRFGAVAGMGYPGTFGPAELRKLANKLTLKVATLPNAATICTVLIGSGAGNLPVSTCVRAMLRGVVDALSYERLASKIRTIRIIEREIGKAHEIHEVLEKLTKDAATTQALKATLAPVEIHESAYASTQLVVPMALARLALGARRAGKGGAAKKTVDEVLADLPGPLAGNREALAELVELADGATTIAELAGRLSVGIRDRSTEGHDALATRFSIVRDRDELVAAALANTAVVPQRVLRFDLKLFDELAEKTTDPLAEDSADLGMLTTRLLIPPDFVPLLTRGSSVIAELDRYTARMTWELLATMETIDGKPRPLALDKPFARQLRTSYSGAPAAPVEQQRALRILVIGDPGDPSVGDNLPGARREALAVMEHLRSDKIDLEIEVEARIGAPSAPRRGDLRGVKPAGRLEILKLLLSGEFDIVHYCGHGSFEPDNPNTGGWVFEDGLLTAREIEGIVRAPRLIVANACLSGRLSERRDDGQTVSRPAQENALLPTLADEFFRRGVRDYIGAAWEVSDEGAIKFAERFYTELLQTKTTIGRALLDARVDLEKDWKKYDALWAAYQHYGDPNTALFEGVPTHNPQRSAAGRTPPSKAKRAPRPRAAARAQRKPASRSRSRGPRRGARARR